jgi:hypothetical protein
LAITEVVSVTRFESMSIETETVAGLSGRCAPAALAVFGNPGEARAYLYVGNSFAPMPTPGPRRYSSLEDAAASRCRELALSRVLIGGALVGIGLCGMVLWLIGRKLTGTSGALR